MNYNRISRYRCPSLNKHLVRTEQFRGEQNQIWFSVCYAQVFFTRFIFFFLPVLLCCFIDSIGKGLQNGHNPIKLPIRLFMLGTPTDFYRKILWIRRTISNWFSSAYRQVCNINFNQRERKWKRKKKVHIHWILNQLNYRCGCETNKRWSEWP